MSRINPYDLEAVHRASRDRHSGPRPPATHMDIDAAYARGRSDATRALLAEIARKIPYPVKDCICVWCGDVGARAHSDDCLWKRAQREAAPSPEEGEG